MPYKIIKSASAFVLLLFAVSCTLPGQKKSESEELPVVKPRAPLTLPTGELVPDVTMLNDSSLSYALYIPPSYSKSKKSPVLIMFDAQSRSTLPLKLYKENADQFGYILMCSNNSKNGNPPDYTKHIINSIIAEATTRFSVDTGRLYTAGFSGGGRIAALSAFMNPMIKGVIGIGAGFPGDQMPNHPFRFIGVAGKEDFNFNELNHLDEQLEANKNLHMFFIYNGKHDWCPADIIYKSMALFDADAMRNKIIPVNITLLDEIKKTNSAEAINLKNEDRFLEADKLYQYILECEKNLVETSDIEREITQLHQNKKWLNQQQQLHLLTAEEQTLSQKLMQSIGQPLNWWSEELNKHFTQINATPGSEHSYMLKRAISAAGVQCYMIIQQVLYSNEMEKANYIVTLYNMLEPDYKDSWYYSAVIDARNGNKEKCFKDLNTAIDKGFDDRNRILNEAAFQPLQTESGFAAVLSKIPVQ